MKKGKMRKRGGAKEKSKVVGSGLKDGFENYSDMYYPINIYELANPRLNKCGLLKRRFSSISYTVSGIAEVRA